MVIVEVPPPGAAMGVGLKDAVTPAGSPVAVRATAALKPPVTVVVIVPVPLFPGNIVSEVGAEIVKPGAAIVRVTVAE